MVDGQDTRAGYTPSRILVGVRLTLLLGCAALLLVFHGDLSTRLAGAESGPVEGPVSSEVEWRTAWNEAGAAFKLRERAVAAGDSSALAGVADLPASREDQSSSRWGRGGPMRPVERWDSPRPGGRMRVLRASPDSLQMAAAIAVRDGPGWRDATTPAARNALVAYERSSVDSPWRIVIEVPFHYWRWSWDDLQAEVRTSRIEPTFALRSHLRGRKLYRVVTVPLVSGRTLICGAVHERPDGRLPEDQYCVVALEDDPDVSYYLGSVRLR